MIVITVKIALSILLGFFAGPAAVYVFNHMPAKWLCDYGEVPSQELTDPYVKRIKENPWRWVYSAGFVCLCLRLSLMDLTETDGAAGGQGIGWMSAAQFALAGLFVCWILLIIALADLKYMIIPDQFVVLLAIGAVGFLPVMKTGLKVNITGLTGVWQPLIGFAIGAGFMLIVAGLGALITKKEVMGFGDVKLCGGLGLVLGIEGIIITLILAVLVNGTVAGAGLLSGKMNRSSSIPLGPAICGSAMAYIFIGLPILW